MGESGDRQIEARRGWEAGGLTIATDFGVGRDYLLRCIVGYDWASIRAFCRVFWRLMRSISRNCCA